MENRPSAGVRHWARVVQLQLLRVREANRESLTCGADENVWASSRLHADVHFLVIAIRDVIRFHDAIAEIVRDERLTTAR